MHRSQFLVPIFFFCSFAEISSISQTATQLQGAQHDRLVHFQVINMSGKSREARIRNTVIALPVAEAVTLQVRSGERIKITSDTDRRIEQAIVIITTDEGRTIPVG